jgi:CubicO group peptidase (beta-lactamase class C family)
MRLPANLPIVGALVAVMVMSAAGCATSSTAVARDRPPSSMPALDSIFSAYDRPGIPGASVLVVRDGRVVASRSYGLADLSTQTPTSDRTNYRLASLSKQFTAAAIIS